MLGRSIELPSVMGDGVATKVIIARCLGSLTCPRWISMLYGS